MANGPDTMPHRRVTWFGLYLVGLNLVLLYLLVKMWPGNLPSGLEERMTIVKVAFLRVEIAPETRFLLIVALSGALGSLIHVATSFADYVGNRRLMWSWTWWYCLRPFIGMGLALLVYFIVRGVLTAGQSGADVLNLYGIASVASVVGLLSKRMTDKLEDLFGNLFRAENPPHRSDSLRG